MISKWYSEFIVVKGLSLYIIESICISRYTMKFFYYDIKIK